jgi:V-type H+-transporting ATPase subunit E
VQALFTLMEKDIEISGREEDKDLVEAAAKEAVSQFENDSKWKIKYTVDTELSPNS